MTSAPPEPSPPQQGKDNRKRNGALIGVAAFVLGIAAGQGTASDETAPNNAEAAQSSVAQLQDQNEELSDELADTKALVDAATSASPQTVIETQVVTETQTMTETVTAPAPQPTQQPAPQPTATYGAVPDTGGGSPYYANCSEAKAAGAAPLYAGQPGYRAGLDRDNDGVACEK